MLPQSDVYLGKAEVGSSILPGGTINSPCVSRDLDRPEPFTGSPAFVVSRVNASRTCGTIGEILGRPEMPRRAYRRPSCLYFVHAPQSRRMKIGISVEPLARFVAIKTGSGEPLELLGWTDYSHCRPEEVRALEQELHAAFAPWRLEGEWFEALPDILQFAYETRDPETTPERRALPVIDPDAYVDPRRPVIPDDIAAPKGNGRKARMERYKLARGLTA